MVLRLSDFPDRGKSLIDAIVLRQDGFRRASVMQARLVLLKFLLKGDGFGAVDDIRPLVIFDWSTDPRCLGGVPLALAKRGIIARGGHRRRGRRLLQLWRLASRTKAQEYLALYPDPWKSIAERAGYAPNPLADWAVAL